MLGTKTIITEMKNDFEKSHLVDWMLLKKEPQILRIRQQKFSKPKTRSQNAKAKGEEYARTMGQLKWHRT